MEIRIYSLFSGSSGNCTWFKIGDMQFLVDVGGSCKSINDALGSLGSSLDKISHVFITHEHSDHVKGLPVICKRFRPRVHIHKASFQSSKAICDAVDPELVDFFESENAQVSLTDNIIVSVFPTPHDSKKSCAVVVDCFGKRFAVATDMGYVTRGAASVLLGTEALILESNYDYDMLKNGPYPDYLKSRIESNAGHLDNKVASKFAAYLAQNGTGTVVLGHLSNENNTPKVALSQLEKELAEQNIEYFKDVEKSSAQPCGVVENSVEIVENHIKNTSKTSTFTDKTENFAVDTCKTDVEKVDETVENLSKKAQSDDFPVENSTLVNNFTKNAQQVEISSGNVEKNQKIRIAVASRYTPTMVFEGEV